MSNLWRQFQALLPREPLLVATVSAHNSDGTSTVQFPGGGTARVKSQTVAVGTTAYVQGGWIKGEAPDLALYEFEV